MTIEERLVHDHGITDSPYLAAWLLKDGTWVNGSIEGYQRDMDHAEIGYYFKKSKFEQPGSAYIYMRKFMCRGNIRIGCNPGFAFAEMLVPPTRQQASELLRVFGQLSMYRHDDVLIERKNTKGERVKMDLDGFRQYVNQYCFRTYRMAEITEHGTEACT